MSGALLDPSVLVLGGGLAGLSAAIQIRRRHQIPVTLVERATPPFPEAAHKVGESTVEIGARYLSHHLGLEQHLRERHLPKFGLRCFFGDRGADLSDCDEVGTSRVLRVPTFQIDRGRLENHLWGEAEALGVDLRSGCRVEAVRTGDDGHRVSLLGDAGAELGARWLIDASGRRGLLRNQFDLTEDNRHLGCSVWFRVRGRVRVDDWSDDRGWHHRLDGTPRWYSTNHLMGTGYWVWLIPLAEDITSVGVVFDPRCVPFEPLRDYAGVLDWLARRHPRLAEDLAGRQPMDFRFLRDYSHGCRQVLSPRRWALTGEAGVFLDPFYSPGTDFIGIGNTFITELIGHDLAGTDLRLPSRVYQQLFNSFYESTLLLYRDQYPGFGDSRLMAVKTVWDYAYYWGVLSLLFFTNAMSDLGFMAALGDSLIGAQKANRRIQKAFRERAARRLTCAPAGYFVDQSALPLLRRFNADLVEPWAADDLAERLRDNIATLGFLSQRLQSFVEDEPEPACERERACVGDLRERLGV